MACKTPAHTCLVLAALLLFLCDVGSPVRGQSQKLDGNPQDYVEVSNSKELKNRLSSPHNAGTRYLRITGGGTLQISADAMYIIEGTVNHIDCQFAHVVVDQLPYNSARTYTRGSQVHWYNCHLTKAWQRDSLAEITTVHNSTMYCMCSEGQKEGREVLSPLNVVQPVTIANATYTAIDGATVALDSVAIRCNSLPLVEHHMPLHVNADTDEAAYFRQLEAALARQETAINEVLVMVDGLYSMRATPLWNGRNLPVQGVLSFTGLGDGTRATLDFYRNQDVFQLAPKTMGEEVFPSALVFRNLEVINLPLGPAIHTEGPFFGSLITCLFWVFTIPSADNWDQYTQRFQARPLRLENVSVVVECDEVAIILGILEHSRTHGLDVTLNIHDDLKGTLDGVAVYEVSQDRQEIVFEVLDASSVFGRDVTLTCREPRRGSRIPLGFSRYLTIHGDNDVRVSTVPGGYRRRPDNQAKKLSTLSVGIICGSAVATAFMLLGSVWLFIRLRRHQKRQAQDFPDNAAGGAGGPLNTCLELARHSTARTGLADGSGRLLTLLHKGCSGRASLAADDAPIGVDAAELHEACVSVADGLRHSVQQLKISVAPSQLRLLSVIGAGACGLVYRGVWKGLEVAVKIVQFQSHTAALSTSQRRAFAEAAIAANLAHDNVVATYAHDLQELPAAHADGTVDYRLYLIQEYCAGGSLANFVAQGHLRSPAGGVLTRRLLPLLSDIADGLEHVHSKLIAHGDVRAANVLLQVDGYMRGELSSLASQSASSLDAVRSAAAAGGEAAPSKDWSEAAACAAAALDEDPCLCHAKVADFRQSWHPHSLAEPGAAAKLGTTFHSAPELKGGQGLVCASDVFSFGVLMWEMFMQQKPYTRTAANALVPHPHFPSFPARCPLSYALLTVACLSHEPADRPAFRQIRLAFATLRQELLTGTYTDMNGVAQGTERLLHRPDDEPYLPLATGASGAPLQDTLTPSQIATCMPSADSISFGPLLSPSTAQVQQPRPAR